MEPYWVVRPDRMREALSRGIHDCAGGGSPITAIAGTLELVKERGFAGCIDRPQLWSPRKAPAPNGTSPP